MAFTISNLGDGNGFVYVTLADGTTLISNFTNNTFVWQQIQSIASTSASLTNPLLTTDSTFGFRFFGNTAGTEGDLTGATEITRLIVGRGAQSATFKEPIGIIAGVATGVRVQSGQLLIIDTQGSVAADDLDTLNVIGSVDNDTVAIIGYDARIVTLKNGIGNIFLNGADFKTGDSSVSIILRYFAASDRWYEVIRGSNLPTVSALRTALVAEPVQGVNLTTLTAGGGTINIEAGVDKGTQVFTGTANLAASWVIQPTAVPTTPYLDGDEIWVVYNAALTSATGAETVTIFGILLTQRQAIEGAITIRAKYKLSNTTWYSDIIYSNPKTTQVWANAAARAAAIPDFDGQLGTQLDTDKAYVAASTAINSWILIDPLPTSGGDTFVLQKTIAGVYSFVPNAADNGILTASVTIPKGVAATSGILGLFAVPVVLIPAPGANQVIEILDAVAENQFNTTAFAGANNLVIRYTGGTTIRDWANTFINTGATLTVAGLPSYSVAMLQNTGVEVAVLVADPTLGDGAITLNYQYRIIQF